MSDHRPLLSQHVVVTGGNRGIGAAISEAVARLGADVTIMGRDQQKLEAQYKKLENICVNPPLAEQVDVVDPISVEEAFKRCSEIYGDPLFLVNNAGAVETAPFHEMSIETWRRMIDVNLTGAANAANFVLPAMIEKKFGRIVNIASTAGLKGYPYVTAYCAAKHGLIGLTKALAVETVKKGITVNAICPGYTDTDLLNNAIDKIAEKSDQSPADVREKIKAGTPQGRFITPGEVASAVAWLFLPEQRSITGQTIVIDGGELNS